MIVNLSPCGAVALLAALAIGEVRGQQPAPVTTAQPPVLPETVVEAAPGVASVTDDGDLTGTILDGTIFTNPAVIGYRAGTSTSGTIIAIPDADFPGTVNSITRDTLDDQIALRFPDVIRNAGGVTLAGDGLFADRIFLRGLEVGSRNFRKDGFLDPTYVPRDFQNVERIEILKGPASVLYGAGDPAGLVNVITKKPVYDRFANIGYTFGAYQQSRFTFDANGFATQSGKVLYRINAAQEDSNSFIDFNYLNRTQIAPVVTWLIDDDTTLTWNGEWHQDSRIGFQGTPAVNGNPLALPPSRFVGEPANDFLATNEFRQSLVLNHRINDCWYWNIGASSLFYQFPGSTTAAAAQVNPTPPLFVRSRSDIPFEDEQSQSAIGNLAGEFWTGEIYHKALVGMEYNYFDSASQFNSGFIGTPFDVSNPVYTDPAATPVFSAAFPVFRRQRVGGYLQDFVEFTPKIKGLAGVRFDWLDQNFQRNIGFGTFNTDDTFNRVSPRAGLVYQPYADDTLSYYYSYAQSFTPPGGGIYLNGGLLPIIGESHEAGIKTLLLPNLSLTAAGFHATRQNDAFNVQSIFLAQVGQVRSQGAELNLLGNITDYWSVIANYTYTDAVLEDSNPTFNGRRARNVPWNTANVWTRYNLMDDCCQTMGLAMGLVYVGERTSGLTAPTVGPEVFLPGFTRWDAGVYYRRGQLNTAIYLENLFDVQYATASVNENQIFQGAPLNVRATVSYLY